MLNLRRVTMVNNVGMIDQVRNVLVASGVGSQFPMIPMFYVLRAQRMVQGYRQSAGYRHQVNPLLRVMDTITESQVVWNARQRPQALVQRVTALMSPFA
jgi:hypothetical protein